MAATKQVKDKIRATSNIKQITRAMEMVAATKMRKAETCALGARPYAKEALLLLSDVLRFARAEELKHRNPLMQKGKGKLTCLVVITSDRGLCGPYNNAVLRASWKFFQDNRDVSVITIGRKGQEFFERRGVKPEYSFFQFSDIANLGDIVPLADVLLSSFARGAYAQVVFCSTAFISALAQEVRFRQILPLELAELEQIIADIVPKKGKYAEFSLAQEPGKSSAYVLEPSWQELFDTLVAELVRVEILHLVFEANASEHSSRMVAMKNATENAEDLIEFLTRQLNKARQAAITQELAEVTTAKEALTAE